MTAHVLVIDDDPVQRRLLKNAVERYGHLALLAENGKAGLELLKQYSGEINVVVLDLMMPEMDGLGFLKAVGELGVDVPVIVQTGQGGIDTVVQAMRAGAFDFVVKPVSPERIGAAISNALKLDRREAKARTGRRGRSNAVNFTDIVSASPAMLRVIELAQRAAQSSIPVVLEGESGVGKEMVARAIQSAGDRANKPFITVNCGAIPHNLVESILFGHEKGAFTGATEKHVGKFMEADGGTLFLDEIGTLSLVSQGKLLRALQEGEIEPLGSNKLVPFDARVIAATSRDLPELVRRGQFREDLYYRLNVLPLRVPPLRERRADIPALVEALGEDMALRSGEAPPELTPDALALLAGQHWRGNIRELRNVLEQVTMRSDSQRIDAVQLERILREAGLEQIELPATLQTSHDADEQAALLRPLSQQVAELERKAIAAAMASTGGNKLATARLLGISRATLYERMTSQEQ